MIGKETTRSEMDEITDGIAYLAYAHMDLKLLSEENSLQIGEKIMKLPTSQMSAKAATETTKILKTSKSEEEIIIRFQNYINDIMSSDSF